MKGKITITATESRCKKPLQIDDICKMAPAYSWEEQTAEVNREDFEYVLKIFGLL